MNGAVKIAADCTNFLFLIFGVMAIYLIGMWPVDDSVAMRMTDEAWRMEALHRFMILSAGSFGVSLFSLLGHLALFRIAAVGSKQHAKRWGLFSLLVLQLSIIATIFLFLFMRPWF